MKDTVLHLGCDATGLVSIIRHFYHTINLEIFLINDDTTFSDDAKVLYWSNLKRQRYYELAPELGFHYKIFDKVFFSNVVDIFELEKLAKIYEKSSIVHFVISNNKAQLIDNLDTVAHILSGKKTKSSSGAFIVYLVNSYNSDEFKDLLSRRYPEINLDKISIIECLTDVLCSIPHETFKRCIVASENRNILIQLNKYDVRKIKLDNCRETVEFLFNRKSSVIKNISTLRNKFNLCRCLMLLLSIYAADVGHMYIFGYLKFIPSARLVAERLIAELTYIILVDPKLDNVARRDLESYFVRLENYGGNVLEILPASKIELLEIKDFLYETLNPGIKNFYEQDDLWRYSISEFEYIPYALKLLNDQIKLWR
ncbi:hypothetical protein [Mucilaginibacter ginsenosidivorax]|uniref:Uncharacterized protein n=1 Tax=Mucilaginibacter ginsenosidivorax TaxID=862126 RepID=A0A5B8W6A9_9SPHI|nr:hypothetical protein [Mucilaginibacter ginsenosidivorax]QEC79343.1 hypothetical protein FSB76_26590 [Mucilaginibacter ginsenosidivorax]